MEPNVTPLEDYALLGDRRTAALVSRAGSVDWWCVPRFDGAACFAALLGAPEHGRFLIAPAGGAQTSRRYRPGTMVLETEHRTATGAVLVTDCLVTEREHPMLVRIVEGLDGDVDMEVELIVRFDYGSIVPWVRRTDRVLTAVGGPDGLALRTPVHTRGRELTTVGAFTVAAGERVPLTLEWFASHEPVPTPIDAAAIVEATGRWWERWTHQATLEVDERWREPVLRSLLTLEALTFAPTGGIVAAPTTSLPEHVGGTRNWDYRYCWVRDATLTLEALLICGRHNEAHRWRDWLLRAAAGDPDQLQIMYGVAGERRLTELTLDWLPGYASSRPVRIGNDAHAQLQLDVYGELVDALWQGSRAGAEIGVDAWALVEVLLRSLESRWREADEGIWEVRGPRRHFTHSKVMSWVAFDRAVAIAERTVLDGPVERWRACRDEIHAEVCTRGYDAERNTFVQSYDSPLLDAATLMIPIVGFLPPDDRRVRGTIDAIRTELMNGGLVMRYHPTADGIDGIGEPEGVFLPCSFWLVEAMALAGMRDEACALFERLLSLGNDLALFSEEYDTVQQRLVGNFPQAFTHLALIGAAHTLAPQPGSSPKRRRDRAAGGGPAD